MRLYSEIELNEQLDRLHLSHKRKDNVRHLIENITARYSDQIEKMKCCGNCKNYIQNNNYVVGTCKGKYDVEGNNICDKWELAE